MIQLLTLTWETPVYILAICMKCVADAVLKTKPRLTSNLKTINCFFTKHIYVEA